MDGQANGRMNERVERVELKQSLIFYLYLYIDIIHKNNIYANNEGD